MLDTYKDIHNTYDLKGSSLGRSAKEGEKVLKDNDLAEKQGKLHLGSQREAFLKVDVVTCVDLSFIEMEEVIIHGPRVY